MATDFQLYAGDDKQLLITVLDVNGTAVNIAGSTLRWRAARSANRPTATIIKDSNGNGISLSSPAAGQCTVTLNAADTVSLAGEFYHELEVTFQNGTRSKVLGGRMRVLPSLITPTAT